MNDKGPKRFKITQIIYSTSFLIPFLTCVSGSLFLYFNQKFVFGYTPIAGISIAIGLALISGILTWFTISIIKKKLTLRRKRVLQIVHGGLSAIGIFIIVFGFLSANLFISAIRYNTGPILTWATDQDPRTEITVMYRTRNPELSKIAYGIDPNDLNFTKSFGFRNEWHRLSLFDLDPDTKYYYKVGDSPRDTIYHFTTAPSTEENFTFVLFSDPRQNTSPINVLFKRNVPKFMVNTMEKLGQKIDFTICCGDITHDALNEATWKSWFTDISDKSGLASYAPLQVAVGNHERQENWTGEIFDHY
ncbi:MAG: fibronectin type III domain-containing protein, partial [Promethearchaeota archaeon]